jgi:putative drug exporter of the RND superfamily
MTERLARAASRRPWPVLASWILAIVLALAAIALLLPGALTSEQRLTNNPSSYQADSLVAQHFKKAEVNEIVIVRSARYTVADPRFRDFVRRLYEQGRATGKIAGARSWYTTQDPTLVSADRHATLIPLVLGRNPAKGIDKVVAVVQKADRNPDFTVRILGHWTIDRDFNALAQHDLKHGEAAFGGPAALFILLLVFGALVAATIPLVLAIVAILIALGIVAALAHAFELSIFVVNMLTAVGLALGIDYSLFVLSRYREERAAGKSKEDAIAAAGATSSRAVFVSGTAFAVALLGMLLVPDNIMRSLAIGAIVVAVVSVLAALTLIPAILGLLGDRINAVRVPFVGRVVVSGEREARFWGRIVAIVLRRPGVSLVASAAVMLALAYPVLDLKTGFPAVSVFPDRTVSKQGFLALDRGFRAGRAAPVRVVIEGNVRSQQVQDAIGRLERLLAKDPAFALGQVELAKGVALLSASLHGAASDPGPIRAVRKLRGDYIPTAFAGTNARVLVGGETSKDIDYFDTMDYWLPRVFAFVLALSFALLLIAFRSIVVALKAILLNLLSVGAAYGLLVLVFEKGIGAGLLGFRHVDSVVAWVPLFLFCVLFGMSMDYHVFLLSRIRERFLQSGDNTEAVAHGVRTTARLITGAALIIIAVFVGFSTGDLVMFQQMGFGVAVALLLDATIVRAVLVPAAMKLLGKWNWYLPSWLEWIPSLRITEEPLVPP